VFVCLVVSLRLISLGEVKEPKQYLEYLEQKEKEKDMNTEGYTVDDLERYHNKELKYEIGK
jgi:hypothetical protein